MLNGPNEGSLVRFVNPTGFLRHRAFSGSIKEAGAHLNSALMGEMRKDYTSLFSFVKGGN